jgi:hypothetical protein
VPIKVKVTYSSFYQCIEDFNMKASSDVPIQFARAFERYHLARGQHQVRAGGRIAAAALTFLPYTKFAKPGDQHVITAYKGVLYDLYQVFYDLYAFVFSKTVLRGDHFYNLCLG